MLVKVQDVELVRNSRELYYIHALKIFPYMCEIFSHIFLLAS